MLFLPPSPDTTHTQMLSAHQFLMQGGCGAFWTRLEVALHFLCVGAFVYGWCVQGRVYVVNGCVWLWVCMYLSVYVTLRWVLGGGGLWLLWFLWGVAGPVSLYTMPCGDSYVDMLVPGIPGLWWGWEHAIPDHLALAPIAAEPPWWVFALMPWERDWDCRHGGPFVYFILQESLDVLATSVCCLDRCGGVTESQSLKLLHPLADLHT